MRFRHFPLLCIGLPVAALLVAADAQPSVHGKVTAVSARPVQVSGAIEAWVLITLAVGNGPVDVFAPYEKTGDVYPDIGQTCEATVRIGSVHGLVGGTDIGHRDGVMIVEKLRCE